MSRPLVIEGRSSFSPCFPLNTNELPLMESVYQDKINSLTNNLLILFGSLVNPLLRTEEGALNLHGLKKGLTYDQFCHYLQKQAALKDGIAFNDNRFNNAIHLFDSYELLLRDPQFEPLLKILYARYLNHNPQQAKTFFPQDTCELENIQRMYHRLQAAIIRIDPDRFVSNYFSSEQGRQYLRTVLNNDYAHEYGRDATFIWRHAQNDLLRAVGHAGMGIVQTSFVDTTMDPVNGLLGFLGLVGNDQLDLSSQGALRLLDAADLAYQLSHTQRENYHSKTIQGDLLKGVTLDEFKTKVAMADKLQEGRGEVDELERGLLEVWLMAAHNGNWNQFEKNNEETIRVYIQYRTNEMIQEVRAVRQLAKQGKYQEANRRFLILNNRDLQHFLHGTLPEGNQAWHLLWGNGFQEFFREMPSLNRHSFDRLTHVSDALETRMKMGETVIKQETAMAATNSTVLAQATRLQTLLEKTQGELSSGYFGKKALSRLVSETAYRSEFSDRGDRYDIEKANEEMEKWIGELSSAKTEDDVRNIISEIFISLEEGKTLYRGFQAADEDGNEELFAVAQILLEIRATTGITKGTGILGLATKGVKLARGVRSVGVARAAYETSRLARAAKAFDISATLALEENVVAMASGGECATSGWGKDCLAAGISSAATGLLNPSHAFNRNLTRNVWERYTRQTYFIAADMGFEVGEEIGDSYFRQVMDLTNIADIGDVRLTRAQLRRITSASTFGGGFFKVGSIAESVKWRSPVRESYPANEGTPLVELSHDEYVYWARRLGKVKSNEPLAQNNAVRFTDLIEDPDTGFIYVDMDAWTLFAPKNTATHIREHLRPKPVERLTTRLEAGHQDNMLRYLGGFERASQNYFFWKERYEELSGQLKTMLEQATVSGKVDPRRIDIDRLRALQQEMQVAYVQSMSRAIRVCTRDGRLPQVGGERTINQIFDRIRKGDGNIIVGNMVMPLAQWNDVNMEAANTLMNFFYLTAREYFGTDLPSLQDPATALGHIMGETAIDNGVLISLHLASHQQLETFLTTLEKRLINTIDRLFIKQEEIRELLILARRPRRGVDPAFTERKIAEYEAELAQIERLTGNIRHNRDAETPSERYFLRGEKNWDWFKISQFNLNLVAGYAEVDMNKLTNPLTRQVTKNISQIYKEALRVRDLAISRAEYMASQLRHVGNHPANERIYQEEREPSDIPEAALFREGRAMDEGDILVGIKEWNKRQTATRWSVFNIFAWNDLEEIAKSINPDKAKAWITNMKGACLPKPNYDIPTVTEFATALREHFEKPMDGRTFALFHEIGGLVEVDRMIREFTGTGVSSNPTLAMQHRNLALALRRDEVDQNIIGLCQKIVIHSQRAIAFMERASYDLRDGYSRPEELLAEATMIAAKKHYASVRRSLTLTGNPKPHIKSFGIEGSGFKDYRDDPRRKLTSTHFVDVHAMKLKLLTREVQLYLKNKRNNADIVVEFFSQGDEMVANFVGHDEHGNEITFEDIEQAYRAVTRLTLPGKSVRTYKTPLGEKNLPRLPVSIVTFNEEKTLEVEGSTRSVVINPGTPVKLTQDPANNNRYYLVEVEGQPLAAKGFITLSESDIAIKINYETPMALRIVGYQRDLSEVELNTPPTDPAFSGVLSFLNLLKKVLMAYDNKVKQKPNPTGELHMLPEEELRAA